MISLELKKLCSKKGISLSELATKVGINKVTMYYYVGGKTFPSADVLEKMADVLDVSVGELFTPKNDFVALVSVNGKEMRFDKLSDLSEWVLNNGEFDMPNIDK